MKRILAVVFLVALMAPAYGEGCNGDPITLEHPRGNFRVEPCGQESVPPLFFTFQVAHTRGILTDETSFSLPVQSDTRGRYVELWRKYELQPGENVIRYSARTLRKDVQQGNNWDQVTLIYSPPPPPTPTPTPIPPTPTPTPVAMGHYTLTGWDAVEGEVAP